jgi:hypothetical protein
VCRGFKACSLLMAGLAGADIRDKVSPGLNRVVGCQMNQFHKCRKYNACIQFIILESSTVASPCKTTGIHFSAISFSNLIILKNII